MFKNKSLGNVVICLPAKADLETNFKKEISLLKFQLNKANLLNG
jgi:hypothetical protein